MPYHRGRELANTYERAREAGYGFVASNVTEWNICAGLVRGAAAATSDLVVQIKRDTARYVGDGDAAAGFQSMAELVRLLGEGCDVGVFCNVDHVDVADLSFLDAVVESGLPSSVMVDGSHLPFEENVERTAAAVDRVASGDGPMLVEAELGTIAGTEGGETTTDAYYTDPEAAVTFVEQTGCDLLAVSIGTQHGVADHVDLDLRVDLAREIAAALADHGLDVPLVVHGSSGLTGDQVAALLETGVCKLNTNTRYQYEYARTAAEFYRDHADSIVPPGGVDDDRETLFGTADWSPEKQVFTPHRVGRAIRDRIAAVYEEFAAISGSAGESRYA
ncbi:MAG: class II fructose-bisphosphate aldolase [Haloferacaceae archaeon]